MRAAVLEYRSSWTAADLADIPGEFRAEIVHGALVINPAPTKRHQRVICQMVTQLDPQLPDGWIIVSGVDVVFAADHTRRPDVVVVRAAAIDVEPTPVADVGLIVEIVSPGSETADRRDKPEEYAAAGIPAYWRIEPRGALALISYELVGDNYLEHQPVTDTFSTRQPWPMTIDVPDLARISPKG